MSLIQEEFQNSDMLATGWKLRSETSITAPTVIEDYGSPHPRLFTYQKLTCLSRQCSGQCPGTESPPRVAAPHQWVGVGREFRHRVGGARPWLIQPRVADPQLERDSAELSTTKFLAEIDWEERMRRHRAGG